MGGHYEAAIVKQGLTEAPFSEDGLKELILKVDAETAVPEKSEEIKPISTLTLTLWGPMRPMARQSQYSISLHKIY